MIQTQGACDPFLLRELESRERWLRNRSWCAGQLWTLPRAARLGMPVYILSDSVSFRKRRKQCLGGTEYEEARAPQEKFVTAKEATYTKT